jgi:hypothetical protein
VVVHEARLERLRRADAPARLLLGFDDRHRPARVGEAICGNEAVGPRPDDDGVAHWIKGMDFIGWILSAAVRTA